MADETEQGLVQIIPLEGGYNTIELRGGGLPFKGAAFPTDQRIKTTYYPGNPVATQTVGGPTKPNTTFRGRWMDQDLSEGGARSLQRRIEFLVERAIPVEVRWGGRQLSSGEDPAIVRRGLLKHFSPTINRAQDIEWELECEWRGEALQTKPPTFSAAISQNDPFKGLQEEAETVAEKTSSWRDSLGILLDHGTNSMLTLSDSLDDLGNNLIDIADTIGSANGRSVAGTISDIAGIPSQIADRIQAVSDHTIETLANARASVDEFCGLWPGMKGLATGDTWRDAGAFFKLQAKQAHLAMFPTDDPLARLDGQTSLNDLVLSWDSLADRAAVASAQLASQRVPDIIAVVRPSAGTDLRDLAVRYYDGRADLWVIIADFNDILTSEVPATPLGASDNGAPPIYIPNPTGYSSPVFDTWGDS